MQPPTPAMTRRCNLTSRLLPATSRAGFAARRACRRSAPTPPRVPDADAIEALARTLAGAKRSALLLGGGALLKPALRAAARAAAACGAQLLCEVFPTRMQRGAGLPAPQRLAYLPELASTQLSGLQHLVLVQAPAPVSFFAYPGRSGELVPAGCAVHELADHSQDATAALEALADALGA